jgi:hypothetical protein
VLTGLRRLNERDVAIDALVVAIDDNRAGISDPDAATLRGQRASTGMRARASIARSRSTEEADGSKESADPREAGT